MDFNYRVCGLGIEFLNQSNYWMWKSCIESYLVAEDLWGVVGGDDTIAPEDDTGTWHQVNAKAVSVLKISSISPDFFMHIARCTSASSIWETLYRLFNKDTREANADMPPLEDADAYVKGGDDLDFFGCDNYPDFEDEDWDLVLEQKETMEVDISNGAEGDKFSEIIVSSAAVEVDTCDMKFS
ncbi:hypothetical protein CRG98_015003 [Punica granatum]|uniref:Uncharacterized protein n=1 Tax=Punica granatum TaxID=22663 RepID=A0A2I0K7P2_PUNGR|nr:hypothetical protein CRG98_015003 [Punica granatum]